MTNQTHLKTVYLFQSLNPVELDAMAKIVDIRNVMPGETIFLRGEKATALYLIKSGSVRIQQSNSSGDSLEVATLSAGSHFGEMAFVDNELRSATAVAGDRLELMVLPYTKLSDLLAQNKDIAVKVYRELAHFLCGRLRVTTNDLSFAREKNYRHF